MPTRHQAEPDTNAAATIASDAVQVPPDPPATPRKPPVVAPAKDEAPAFAGRVWHLLDSSAVQAGTTYTFLADGSLLIGVPGGSSTAGRWGYRDRQLTMIEEGISYPVEIVHLDANHFIIRSDNPAGAATIAMQAAPDVALPGLQ